MSTLSSVSGSSGASYATQLAQSSSLESSLYNLGNAVQNGNLTSAGSILTAIIQANPQYANTSSSGSSSSSSPSSDPINQDFQNLATAISSGDTGSAQSAWTQLKNDLAQSGVTINSNGAQLAAQAVAQSTVSIDQSILSSFFDASSSNSSDSSDPLSALVTNWLTYKADGAASASSANSGTASILDSLA
jgi:hypothetical protein